MSDKTGPSIADVKAKHFRVIIDDLESSAEEHGVHTQNAVYIAMCYGFRCAIGALGKKDGIKAMRSMFEYAENCVVTTHDEFHDSSRN